jgi:hypothetical protein
MACALRASRQGGVDGTRTRGENTQQTLENKPDRASDVDGEKSRLTTARDESRPVETAHGAISEPSDAELERGILEAVKMGLGDVARSLSARLDARQRARAGNVVLDLDSRRRR